MDADLDIGQFLSGGYLLAKTYTPPADSFDYFYLGGENAQPLLSASPCISEILPDDSGYEAADLETVLAYGREWGIPQDRVGEFQAWKSRMTVDGRVRHAGAFADLDTARECVREFVSARAGVHLLGIALHRDLLADFVEAVGPCERMTPDGVHDLVQEARPLASGARHLGYEPLDVYPCESRHTWHCHGLVREMHEKYGIAVNDLGLIASHEHACRVAAVCDDPDYGCEPGVWRAWRIVEYDLDG